MSRPDPIQYAERLYTAIRAANFSPIAFLAFGNAVKDGVDFRRMPRMAAEPFMRVVGEMLDLEEDAAERHCAEPATIRGGVPSPPEPEHAGSSGIDTDTAAKAVPSVDEGNTTQLVRRRSQRPRQPVGE